MSKIRKSTRVEPLPSREEDVIKQEKRKLQNARADGWNTFTVKKESNKNPFELNTPEYKAFDDGYKSAQATYGGIRNSMLVTKYDGEVVAKTQEEFNRHIPQEKRKCGRPPGSKNKVKK
ncbi:MAG TPA: hypothetical protein VKR58_06315 [Aquella sp.]|nr:hypothetical protein [Aquella sp.]